MLFPKPVVKARGSIRRELIHPLGFESVGFFGDSWENLQLDGVSSEEAAVPSLLYFGEM